MWFPPTIRTNHLKIHPDRLDLAMGLLVFHNITSVARARNGIGLSLPPNPPFAGASRFRYEAARKAPGLSHGDISALSRTGSIPAAAEPHKTVVWVTMKLLQSFLTRRCVNP